MRVLVVDSYEPSDPNARVVDHVVAALWAKKHDVERLSLAGNEFAGFMSADEHSAYETKEPLLADETRTSAALVQRSDALVFCYPTTLFGVPPRLKSWLERVMVLGVAFVFDDNKRIRPGLTNVTHLGVVTTSPHSLLRTLRARDLGRRTFMRTLRLNCNPRCARTFVRLGSGSKRGHSQRSIERRFSRWR